MNIPPLENEIIGVYPYGENNAATIECYIRSERYGNQRICVRVKDKDSYLSSLRDINTRLEQILSAVPKVSEIAGEYLVDNHPQVKVEDLGLEGVWIDLNGDAVYSFMSIIPDINFVVRRSLDGYYNVQQS